MDEPKLKWPIAVRDTPPLPGMVKIENKRADGVQDGIHTGSVWINEANEVWKALDGRPYANCEFQYPTRELEFLKQFEGLAILPEELACR